MSSLIEYPADDTCLMWLVRHGATPHNLQNPPRLQGSGVDEPLSELGQEQAKRVAGLLATRPIGEVFCSPMHRAAQTAGVIAAEHGLDVTTVDSLIEVNVGAWEGRTWAEIRAEDPENYARFMENPAEHGYPGGETMASVIARARLTLAGLMHPRLGQEIVVVAHSVVNRSYLGSLLGLTPQKGYKVPQLNCAVNLVRWRDGEAKAVAVNSVSHLM